MLATGADLPNAFPYLVAIERLNATEVPTGVGVAIGTQRHVRADFAGLGQRPVEDVRHRLQGYVEVYAEEYTYDPAGNVVSVIQND